MDYYKSQGGRMQTKRLFEHGLENWNASAGPGNEPIPEVPKRLFYAWIEDWEWECLHHDDPEAEAKLLQK